MVSTDLLSRPEVMAEFVEANSDQFYKAWKKLELQQWLKNHGLKVSGTKEELVAEWRMRNERELRQWSKELHVKIRRLQNELLKS